MKLIEEGNAKIEHSGGVFYNPHMELSRNLSVLALKRIKEPLRVLDAFTATGIRGIRYALETNSVEEVHFLDIDETAIRLAEKNAKRNGVSGKFIKSDFNAYIFNTEETYNFIELDPFGTPSPYLWPALRHLSKNKTSYLSLTATDTGVLCGVHWRATFKNYGSLPFHVPFCHEYGLRILLKRVAEIASSFNLYTKPILSFYYRHQMKVIVKLERGQNKAHKVLNHVDMIHFCENCLYVKSGYEGDDCPRCGSKLKHGGFIWKDHFADVREVKEMLPSAEGKEKKILEKILGEQNFPPWHISTHLVAKKLKVRVKPMKELFKRAEELNHAISRTHFDDKALKAYDISVIEELMKL